MTATPETLPTENIFGTAKRMTLELEKFALHSHAAVVAQMKVALEHRQIALQNEMALKQKEAQDKAMEAAIAAQARSIADEQARKEKQAAREVAQHAGIALVGE